MNELSASALNDLKLSVIEGEGGEKYFKLFCK